MSTNQRRFRIAFSFAGEKRAFVAHVARIMAERFGEPAILYDKYHEAEFARGDLGIYLPELYHKDSDLVVVVVCPAYDEKEWTGLEWTAIHDLLKQRKHDEVMLFRFERTDLTGLYSTAGFADLDDKTPEQAAYLILERLALNEGKPKNYYATSANSVSRPATTSIPNNLPRLQSFFGRTEELKQIAEALDHDTRTWGTLLDGPGGMGKTSLAIRAAYDCPPGQFDRIIFLSVKDRELDDDGERRLGAFILPGFLEMLNELARELDKPEITKSSENERIRLIVDALSSTRTLLILDNLESLPKSDRDQLITFVKRLPQGCKAILTSRRRIGSSAEVLILRDLDEDSALQTLADLAQHNPLLARTSESDRRSLYVQTGGNPLLLRWTAGQLGRGSCRTIADALAFLRSGPSGNDALEFVFGDLAKEFTDDETRVLAALTYFTLPTTVKHIATLADLSKEKTESALRTLANRSLVVPDQEEKAFALVPMVADFLRRTRPEIVQDTGTRLQNLAYALIVENGYSNYDGFRTLDAEWATVASALPLFVGGSHGRLQVVCEALYTFLDFRMRWDEWLFLEQQAEARAEAAKDYVSAGLRALRTGWVHKRRREGDAIFACADRAAKHWDIAKAPATWRNVVLELHGFGYLIKQDYINAIAAHRESLKLTRSVSEISGNVARAFAHLARAEQQAGELAAAEEHLYEARRIALLVNDNQSMARATALLGEVMLNKENWQMAESFAREALPLLDEAGDKWALAMNGVRLARALLRQGRSSEALPHAKRAVSIFEDLRPAEDDMNLARATLAECKAQIPEDKSSN
ncbi:MAG TPA: AAA family ATPase [Pyrinomonadaceae bacterium]|nr:AAA family ATPase [Pyrinomonadaceae bacterium]